MKKLEFKHHGKKFIEDFFSVGFEKGDFGEIETIYKELLQKNPEISPIRFALADILERKGELTAAIDLCKKALDHNPDSEVAKKYLIKFYGKTGQKEEALELALALFESSFDQKTQFTCNVCHNQSDDPLWRCPKCKEWNTYVS